MGKPCISTCNYMLQDTKAVESNNEKITYLVTLWGHHRIDFSSLLFEASRPDPDPPFEGQDPVPAPFDG